jgi:hypothetical protein
MSKPELIHGVLTLLGTVWCLGQSMFVLLMMVEIRLGFASVHRFRKNTLQKENPDQQTPVRVHMIHLVAT